MDDSGSIHVFDSDELKALLEKLNGKLIEIDSRELLDVVQDEPGAAPRLV